MDDLTIDARKQELLEARFLGLAKVRWIVRLRHTVEKSFYQAEKYVHLTLSLSNDLDGILRL